MNKFARCLLSRVRHIVFVSLLSPIAFSIAPIGAGQNISVDRSIQVSTDDSQRDHSEVLIAADPSSPRHLLACSIVTPTRASIEISRVVAYVSFDGGSSWSKTLELGGELAASDPSCAFGPEGAAYYAAIVLDFVGDNRYEGKTVFYGSSDGGKTWSLRSKLPGGDREFITVDERSKKIYMVEEVFDTSASGTSAGEDRLPLLVYESDDGGRSFRMFRVRGALHNRHVQNFVGGYPGGILPDGTFVTSFSYLPEGIVQIQGHSTGSGTPVADAGALRYEPNAPDRTTTSLVNDLYSCNTNVDSIPITSLAVDSSTGVFRGRMYVAWPDSRSGRCEILLSWSADQGKIWSTPITVNDDRSRIGSNNGPEDFHPVLAVSPRGVLGVFWYDRRDNQDNLGWRPRFSASLDGGQTFLPSVEFRDSGMHFYQGSSANLSGISQGGGDPFTRRVGFIQTELGYVGHGTTGGETAGLAADASGAFHGLWIDNRTGIRQVWTARITVDGTATKNGSNDLASLDDVSGDVTILLSSVKLNKVNQTITTDAYIQNTSPFNLIPPLKLRVLQLQSRIGVPRFMNADNHEGSSGAIFDFSSLVPGAMLSPGQRSNGKQIEIHLDHMLSEIPTGDYDTLQQMVTINSLVLGVRGPGTKPAAIN